MLFIVRRRNNCHDPRKYYSTLYSYIYDETINTKTSYYIILITVNICREQNRNIDAQYSTAVTIILLSLHVILYKIIYEYSE